MDPHPPFGSGAVCGASPYARSCPKPRRKPFEDVMDITQIPIEDHYREAEAFHGHLCGGIISGVRMALLGLESVGIRDPKGKDQKKLLVFVEIDRCATDAITSVTGCRPGRRTMKIKDYGKMAATFINLETGKAVRIASQPRDRSNENPEDPESVVQKLKQASLETLFRLQHGKVALGAGDMPGRPVRSINCACCGETVMDMRDVMHGGQILCQPCAEGSSYFQPGTQL